MAPGELDEGDLIPTKAFPKPQGFPLAQCQ
jgi:hypothetical protein